jgi:hypothetical protein
MTIDPRTPEIYDEIEKALENAKLRDRGRIINTICEKYKISKYDLIMYEQQYYPPKFLIKKPQDE